MKTLAALGFAVAIAACGTSGGGTIGATGGGTGGSGNGGNPTGGASGSGNSGNPTGGASGSGTSSGGGGTTTGGCATALCGGSCCEAGDSCIGDACCAASQSCGSSCCDSGDSCVGNACCSGAQACGSMCCAAGSECVEDQAGNPICGVSCEKSADCSGEMPCCEVLGDRDGGGVCAPSPPTASSYACLCVTSSECSGECAPGVNDAGIITGPYICAPDDGSSHAGCGGAVTACSVANQYCSIDQEGNAFCSLVCGSDAACGNSGVACCDTSCNLDEVCCGLCGS